MEAVGEAGNVRDAVFEARSLKPDLVLMDILLRLRSRYVQRWLLRRLSVVEQWVMIVCGLALIYPAQAADWVGFIGIAAVLAWQWIGRKTVARARS